MSIFNERHVIPENKYFSVINTILAIIDKHFPEVGVVREEEFYPQINILDIEKFSGGMDSDFLEKTIKLKSKLYLQAFPKNKNRFIIDLLPEILYSIKTGTNISSYIKNSLDFPEIPENKEKVFLGTNTFSGKTIIDSESLIYDTYIRSDELGESNIVYIKNSKLIKAVLHGGGDKQIENSDIVCTVVHGKIDIINSNIGNYKHHSVFHDSSLENSFQETGGVVAIGFTSKDSNIGFGTIFMPGSEILDKTQVGDYSILGNRKLIGCIVGKNTHIGNGNSHFEKTAISGQVYTLDNDKYYQEVKTDFL